MIEEYRASRSSPTGEQPAFGGHPLATVFLFGAAFVAGCALALLLQVNWLAGIQASLSGAQPKAYWYLSRATAFVAFGLLWLSMALGLAITNKLARLWPGGPAAADLHQYSSLLGLAFGCFHGLILTGDSYSGYTLAQVTFFLQHLLLLAGLWALARTPALRSNRIGRVAGGGAVVGMALLAVLELAAVTAADEATTSDRAQLVNNLYSVPVLLLGVALVVAGVVALRAGRAAWAGAPWLPLVVLALGIYVFVPLTPAIMGPFVAGRLGIGGWMALFAVLGAGLARLEESPARR